MLNLGQLGRGILPAAPTHSMQFPGLAAGLQPAARTIMHAYPPNAKLATMLARSASALSPFTESVLIWYS